MDVVITTFFVLVLIGVGIYTYKAIDPKIDNNYETKEKVLWFNNPLNNLFREYITLYKIKDLEEEDKEDTTTTFYNDY